MESFNGGNNFAFCRHTSQKVMYSKLRRYLISVSLSGVSVILTRDMWHTAYDVAEHYHYFQKPWDNHTSLLETQKLNIPCLTGKPSLVRKWASDIEGVGVKLGMEAEKLFKRPIVLANSQESDWLRLNHIGVATAQKIVKEIYGRG